jgi:hypothetical protein
LLSPFLSAHWSVVKEGGETAEVTMLLLLWRWLTMTLFFRCDSHVASGTTGMPGQSAEASLPSALLLMTKEQVNGVILTAFGIRTR